MQKPWRNSNRRAFVASCALVAPLVCVYVPATYAQAPVPPQSTAGSKIINSVDVRDARLEEVVYSLTTQNGLTNIVIINEPGKNFGLVTVKLLEQPLSVVLNAIAMSAGATIEEKDGIFYLKHKSAQAEKPQPAKPVVQETAVVAVPVQKPKSQRQLTKIQLTYLQPSVFKKMLENPDFLALYDTTPPEAKETVTFGTVTTPPLLIPAESNQNGNNAPATTNGGVNTPPAAGVAGGSAGRDGGDAGQRGFGGAGGFGGGQGGLGGNQGGFGGNQGGPGAGGFGQGAQGQNSLRPDGITNLIASDAQNALIVEYDEVEDLNRLREIIRLLDVAPQQVLVKAEFVAVNISDADAFGIDWRFQPTSNTDVAIPPESGTQPTVTMAYASGNAVANMRASLIRNDGNVLQAPIISTINNRPAFITFAEQVSIPQTVNIVGPNGQIVSGTQFVPVTANNGLNVTPHINGDGTISMFLNPQLSSVTLQANGGTRTSFQTLTTTRRIKNGETMVLGGFITKQEDREERRVPLLSDLPIIGNLFIQRSRRVVGSEVLIFVTATIIEDTPSRGGLGAPNSAPSP